MFSYWGRSESFPVSLRDINFPSSEKLLVLAPHPDDFDAVAVAAKFLFDTGIQTLLLVLTGASSGVRDAFVSPPTKENKEEIREQEQMKSLDFFGFPRSQARFLRLPEDDHGDLVQDEGCRSILGKYFQEFDPGLLLLPYGEDTNPSHQRIFTMARDLAKQSPNPITALYNQDPKTVQIRIDAYIEFDEKIALWKREMLRFHQSQQERNLQTRGIGLDDRILNINAQIARQIKTDSKYAEGFQLEQFPTAG